MSQLIECFPYLLFGILCVTSIATLGAWTSRALQVNYAYLTVVSFLVYATLGGVISKQIDLGNAFLVTLTLGFYDGTICWMLCKRFKANMGLSEEEIQSKTLSSNLGLMLIVSPVFTNLGYLLTN